MSLERDFRQTIGVFRWIFRILFRLVKSLLSFVIGIISFGVVKSKIKNTNVKNRGLITEKPQDLNQLCTNGFHQNTIISGGDSSTRSQILSSLLFNTGTSGNSGIVILHMGDYDLINFMKSAGGYNMVQIDRSTQNYDPFFWRTEDEIIMLISNSLPQNQALNNGAMNFLRGMLLYINAMGGKPTLNALVHCPYNELIDRTNDNIDCGRFSEQVGEQIIRYLIAGSSEIQFLSNYFNSLHKECKSILCHSNYMNCVDLKKVIDNGKVLLMDVSTAANNILLNIIFSQIRDILRYSPNTKIVLDNLNISSAETKVQDLIRICNNNLILSTHDLYINLSSDNSLFDILVGRSRYNIILQHNNATSSDKWSEKMGAYDKLETDIGFGDVFSPKLLLGKHMHVAKKQERVVKAEEIQRLGMNEMYIMDDLSNRLIKTSIS